MRKFSVQLHIDKKAMHRITQNTTVSYHGVQNAAARTLTLMLTKAVCDMRRRVNSQHALSAGVHT